MKKNKEREAILNLLFCIENFYNLKKIKSNCYEQAKFWETVTNRIYLMNSICNLKCNYKWTVEGNRLQSNILNTMLNNLLGSLKRHQKDLMSLKKF